MIIKMTRVTFCNVSECAYNNNNACHAMAITIDGPEPMCDTYFSNSRKGGVYEFTGAVGACKNDACSHNESFECQAKGIIVSKHDGKPECDTFSSRTAEFEIKMN